jgi:hypothetical protein
MPHLSQLGPPQSTSVSSPFISSSLQLAPGVGTAVGDSEGTGVVSVGDPVGDSLGETETHVPDETETYG